MLTTRLTNCPECTNILSLIEQIDCKVADISKSMYNEIIFALNSSCKVNIIGDLLIYKRILEYRFCNNEYAGDFSTEQIASKVKLLINK